MINWLTVWCVPVIYAAVPISASVDVQKLCVVGKIHNRAAKCKNFIGNNTPVKDEMHILFGSKVRISSTSELWLNMCVCLSIYLAFCLSIDILIYQSIYLHIHLSILILKRAHTHTYIYTHICIYKFIYFMNNFKLAKILCGNFSMFFYRYHIWVDFPVWNSCLWWTIRVCSWRQIQKHQLCILAAST